MSVRPSLFRAADARPSSSCQFSILQPNHGLPISCARKFTGGIRNSDPVSSTRRMVRSGADHRAKSGQSPRVSKNRMDPSRSATVRPGIRVATSPTTATSTPARASAMPSVRPTAPAPTTMTSVSILPAPGGVEARFVSPESGTAASFRPGMIGVSSFDCGSVCGRVSGRAACGFRHDIGPQSDRAMWPGVGRRSFGPAVRGKARRGL